MDEPMESIDPETTNTSNEAGENDRKIPLLRPGSMGKTVKIKKKLADYMVTRRIVCSRLMSVLRSTVEA